VGITPAIKIGVLEMMKIPLNHWKVLQGWYDNLREQVATAH